MNANPITEVKRGRKKSTDPTKNRIRIAARVAYHTNAILEQGVANMQVQNEKERNLGRFLDSIVEKLTH